MSKIIPPKYVRQSLVKLQARGYPAYLIGKCVRDMLLGRQPSGWEIVTMAKRQLLEELFPALPQNNLSGVGGRSIAFVSLGPDDESGAGPFDNSSAFLGELNAMLGRSDFTLNAVAVSADGLVCDPFGGIEDMEKKLVRPVGQPLKSFAAEPELMFEALQLSARLGFELEPGCFGAMRALAHLAGNVPSVRVRAELEKILLSDRAERVFTAFETGLMDSYIIRRPERMEDFSALSRLPGKALERWVCLGMLLVRNGSIDSAEDFASALELDGRSVRCCAQAQQMLSRCAPQNRYEWKKLLNRCGVASVFCTAHCADAIYGENNVAALRELLKSGECFSVKHLAIGSDELLELGYKGSQLGEMLNFLLEYVMEYPANNRRDVLLSLARASEE